MIVHVSSMSPILHGAWPCGYCPGICKEMHFPIAPASAAVAAIGLGHWSCFSKLGEFRLRLKNHEAIGHRDLVNLCELFITKQMGT